MNHLKKLYSLIVLTLFFGTTSTPGFTSEKNVLSGSVACPATYFKRKGGTEIHDRVYGLRNFNDKSTITITRIRAWYNDGSTAFDSEIDAFPGDGFKSTLNPNESARFKASDVLSGIAELPFFNTQQIRIDYKLDKPGMPLNAGYAHFTRQLNGYQTARQGGVCTSYPPSAK